MSKPEASFIRKQILLKVPDSLLSFLLKNIETRKDFFELDSFEKMLVSLGKNCSYAAALDNALLFDKIMKGAYIRYNYKLSEYADDETKAIWQNYWDDYLSSLTTFSFSISSFDLFFKKFNISTNTVDFCKKWITLVSVAIPTDADIDKLLRTREISLKGTDRSRMNNPSIAQKTVIPIGIRIENRTGEIYYLNYRFNIAKRILEDIYYGLTKSENE